MKRKIFYSIVTEEEVTGVKKQDGYEISAHGMKFNAYKSRDGFVYIVEPAIGISIFENNYYGCRGTREIDIPEEYELVITAKEEFEKRIPKERILNFRETKEFRIMKRMFKSFKRGKELQEKLKGSSVIKVRTEI